MQWLITLQCLILMIVCIEGRVTFSRSCNEGEYLRRHLYQGHLRQVCLPCPRGFFVPFSNHNHFYCTRCLQPRAHEVILRNCTATYNTVVGCAQGYFRHINTSRLSRNGRCQQCPSCESPNSSIVEACQQFLDTICASNLTCKSGQYLTLLLSGQERCIDCPTGTFMPFGNHRDTVCTNCLSGKAYKHEINLQECTATTDTVIGCEAGYYRNNIIINHIIYGKCTRCSSCNELGLVEISPCQHFIDAVCSTQIRPFTCNRGQYVSGIQGNQRCLPCPEGTFHIDDNHRFKSCVKCSIARLEHREVVLRACNSTSDTLIGCLPGYFREKYHPRIYNRHHETCTRCSVCLRPNTYKKRECGGNDDTLCCPVEELAGHSVHPQCASI